MAKGKFVSRVVVCACAMFFLSINAYAADMRMDFEVGYNSGTLRPDGDVGGVDVSGSVGAGSGPMLGMTIWKDRVFNDWISIGLGFRYRNNNTNLYLDSYGGEININSYDLLGKIAVRQNKGVFHPYAGLGAGVTRITTDADGETATGPTMELFAGFDYDLQKNFYMGLETSYSRTYAKAYGVDFSYDSLGSVVKTGYKF